MSIRSSIFILCTLFSTAFLSAQEENGFIKVPSAFEKQWQEFETAQANGMPNRQIEILDDVIKLALAQKNAPEFYRALYHYPATISETLKDPEDKHDILARFEAMPSKLEAPFSNIMHTFLFKQFQNNYYSWDMQSWKGDFSIPCIVDGKVVNYTKDNDTQQIIKAYHVRKSLENPDVLFAQKSFDYANSLFTRDSAAFLKRPTLFDLLASQAIDFLTNSDNRIQIEADPQWYAASEDFLKGASAETLKILQQLELYHWKNKNFIAYTSWVLQRLDYVQLRERRKNVNADNKKLYEALQNLQTRLNGNDATLGVICYEAGEKLRDPANRYHWLNNPKAKDKAGEIHAVLLDAIRQFPNSVWLPDAKNMIRSIEAKNVTIRFQRKQLAGKPTLMTVEYKNMSEAYLTIYHIDQKPANQDYWQDILNPNKHKVHTQKLSFDQNGKFNNHSKDFIIPALNETGTYLFLVTATADSADIITKLSKLDNNQMNIAYATMEIHGFTVVRNSNSTTIKVAVLDQTSGNPIAGAAVYGNERDDEDRTFRLLGKTNSAGEFNSNVTNGMTLKVIHGKDSVTQYVYPYNYYENQKSPNYRYITDRSIYRPGQTVHFKIYAFEGKSPDYKVIAKHESEVAFSDYEGVMIGSVSGYTNEFGTFAGSFTLPRTGKTGGFSVSVNGIQVGNITVEEYKRPSFEVEADFDKKAYKLGDKVTVSGKVKAYAGYGLSDARVEVRISSNYGYRFFYGEEEQLLDTVITANAQGEFSVSFIAKTNSNSSFGASFTYDISATSVAGETQNTSNSIFIGKERPEWDVRVPGQVFSDEKEYATIALISGEQDKSFQKQIEVELARRNPAHVPADIVFTRNEFQEFTAVEFKQQFKDASYFGDVHETPEYITITNFKLNSGDSIELNKLVKNMAGSYELRLRYIDDSDTLSMTSNFTYIRTDSKKNQSSLPLWMVASKKNFHPGDEVSAYLGSKYVKQNVLVEIYHGSELLRHEWISLKGRRKITYKIRPEDLGGININAFTIRNGMLHQASAYIHVPFDSKKLDVKLETVREILRPGANEKWTVSVSTSDGSPLSSELAAGMSDASLDQFVDSPWSLAVYEENYPYLHWEMNREGAAYFRTMGDWGMSDWGDYYSSGFSYGSLKSGDNYDMSEGYGLAVSANATGVTGSAVSEVRLEGGKMDETFSFLPPAEKDELRAPEKARTNFNETAFFYPQLASKDNRFQFEFTLPDALTRWKFQALAHDQLMRFGYRMDEFIAQKELMVDPSEPRFFRAGDEFVLAVNLINLTDKEQNVTATLEWFDPYTNVVIPNILGVMSPQQSKLDAKGMQTVSWTLQIPKTGLDLIAYRVKVSSGQFSDVEEKVIPVLSNRTQVIESVPVTVEGKGSFTFELPKLLQQTSPTQRNEKLVMEYNSNPLWSAVMAIPYITDYPYDCAEQVFSKYFANKLSLAIVQKNPMIQQVLAQPGTNTPDQFLSALQTNEDLKAIVLAETPWVLEAKNEAEQRRRITELFETNNLMQNATTNLGKLNEMQNADGGWSWFAGGKSNVYITQHILSGFGHLKSLGLNYEGFEGMDRALAFLETHYQKQYENLTKEQVQRLDGLSALEIQWLYSREMLASNTSAVATYYAKCLTRDWLKYPLHVQAMAGVYFLHAGQPEMAQKIYTSIQSKATTRKGLGMYWNENKNAYYWDRNAIETQASLIEFFKKSGADQKMLASMKLWLLNQKRGQYWESTKTTAWACYALLMDTKPLAKDNLTEKVFLGGQEVGGAVLGYMRHTYSGNEIQPSMGRMTVEQTAEDPGFGSLNLIYTEEIEKLAKNTTGMQIDKQLFVVRDGKEMPITATTKLVLGDLIRVHLQITSDRALEFVHVKDLRASGMENVETLSAYRSSGNLYYYNTNRDASTEFFLDNLPKGKHTITYDLRISGKGSQSTGYALVECLYAPEFRANSAAGTIRVD